MTSNERYSLTSIIGQDLLRHGKIPLLLMVLIIISALMVLVTTNNTRLKINERARLFLERDALEIEKNNLILEENVLADHSRIERLAKRGLQMHSVDPEKEILIIRK